MELNVSSKPHVLSFNEIKQAADRIEGAIIHTPLCVSPEILGVPTLDRGLSPYNTFTAYVYILGSKA